MRLSKFMARANKLSKKYSGLDLVNKMLEFSDAYTKEDMQKLLISWGFIK